MKKRIAVSILFTVLTAAAAFAQFKVSLYGDFYPDLLLVTSPTGDASRPDNAIGGTGTNVGAYAGSGTTDFFTTSGTWYPNEIRLALSYTDPDGNYEGMVEVNADGLFVNGNPDGRGFFNSGSESEAGILDFLSAAFSKWYVKGTAGIVTGFVGSTDDAGDVDDFNVFNNLADAVNIGGYGLLVPFSDDANLGLDVLNLRRIPDWSSTKDGILNRVDNPYAAVTANIDPIAITVAGDLSGVRNAANTPSYSTVGAAFRVSGNKIADLLTFGAIYKIYGSDPDTDDKISPNPQPDGQGFWNHTFGLFANIDVIENLGIGAGYSGHFSTREDEKRADNNTYKFVYPYLNGIDLRFQYTGVDKLTVTLNNNFSFSGITNDDDNLTEVMGIRDYDNLDIPGVTTRQKEVSEGYFGMWNALGVNYAITDALTANLQVLNRLDTLKRTNNTNESQQIVQEWAKDTFMLTATAAYSFNDNVSLESGLAFKVEDHSEKETNQGEKKEGLFTFGIPINIKISF